jgi:hypothetical protein
VEHGKLGSGPGLQPIQTYAQMAMLKREHFVVRFAHPFLVQAVGGLQRLDPSRRDDLTSDRLVLEGPRTALHESMEVAELAPRDPDQDIITIGVATTCDVVLDDTSVSKRHAWFQRTDDVWRIWDGDSSAGTQVNGQLVLPGYPRALASGDRVILGYVDLMFITSEGFYDLIYGLFGAEAEQQRLRRK